MVWGLDVNVGASSRKARGYDRSLTARLKLREEREKPKQATRYHNHPPNSATYNLVPKLPTLPNSPNSSFPPIPRSNNNIKICLSLLMPLRFSNHLRQLLTFDSYQIPQQLPSLPSPELAEGVRSGPAYT